MIRLFLNLALLFFSATVLAQGQVTFEGYADGREVLLNSYFDVTFTLRNAEAEDFQAPDFKDFTVLAGPSRSLSTTILNGQISKEISFTYTLKPRRQGRFTIGSATVTVNRKKLRSAPISVEVVEGTRQAETRGEPFFIRAEPNTTRSYIGQQISLDYKLFTTVDIESYNVLGESDYQGFYAEDLKHHDGRVMREIIGGVQYTTKVLKRVALFPQQAGALTIEPLQLQIGIVEEDQNNPGSFFFNRQIRRLLAETKPVKITVLPLPQDQPSSFTGAVGRYSISSRLARATLTTDDVLSLQLTITGNGDLKQVLPPAINFPDTFEVYEPRVLEESTTEIDGELIGAKTFEYLALPRMPGAYELTPAFSYFHPDSARFVSLTSEHYNVSVRPGGNRPADAPLLDPEASGQESDIRFIKLSEDTLRRPGRPFLDSPIFWVLTAMPFFLLGGVVIVHRMKTRRGLIDPQERRRQQARRIAEDRLKAADQFRQKGQRREFFDEISKAMLGYVGDKLQIPRSAMSKDNVREKLRSLQIPEEDTARFLSVIQTCEIALFAGRNDEGAMDETYRQAADVLTAVDFFLR